MAKIKTKKLELTDEEISELLDIVDTCQAHLKDYDIDEGIYNEETGEGCIYYDTNAKCDKWATKLEKLQKSKK